MSDEKLFARIDELAKKIEAITDEHDKLTSELEDVLNLCLKGRRCPACGASSRDNTLFAFDYHNGSFAICCDRCGLETPHTTSIKLALEFFDAMHTVMYNLEDIRDKNGKSVIKRKGCSHE